MLLLNVDRFFIHNFSFHFDTRDEKKDLSKIFVKNKYHYIFLKFCDYVRLLLGHALGIWNCGCSLFYRRELWALKSAGFNSTKNLKIRVFKRWCLINLQVCAPAAPVLTHSLLYSILWWSDYEQPAAERHTWSLYLVFDATQEVIFVLLPA